MTAHGARPLSSTLEALGRTVAFLPVAVRHVFDKSAAGPVAFFLSEKAWALGRDHRLNEAVEAWKAVTERYPRLPLAFAGYGGALRRVGRVPESLAVLQAAVARCRPGPGLLHELAMSLLESDQPAEALRVAEENLTRFPGHPLAYESTAHAYRALKRLEDADALLREALDRCPGFVGLAAEYAVNADIRADNEEALRRWSDVRRRFPKVATGFAGLGAALKAVGRFDEADQVLAEGMALYPRDANIAINHAWVAERRFDWPEVVARWTRIREAFPDHPRVRAGYVDAVSKASLAAVDALPEAAAGETAAPPLPLLIESPSVRDEAHAELVKRFESLGETCEFGFVQRHFGAEPLGLLRWAGISHEQSRRGLLEDFSDVGSEGTTQLHVNPDNAEYFTTDKNYGMSMHSFIARDSATEDVVVTRLRRRLKYLRDKLLEDLKTAEKIFVLQTGPDVSDAVLRDYHAAIRRHGPTRLLCVRPISDGKTPGSVEAAGDGLLFGWLDKAGYDGRVWDISFAVWLELCGRAVVLAAPNEAPAPPLTP